MLRYLRIKKRKNLKYIVYREKKKMFDKNCKEKYIPKKKNLLILGQHSSGKTKEFEKIRKKINEIYPKNKIVVLKGKESLSDWLQKNIKEQDKVNFINLKESNLEQEDIEKIEKNINKQYIKIQILVEKAKNNVVIIDDIDALTGKKLEIMKDIMRVAKVTIATAKDVNSIDKTIYKTLEKKLTTIKLTTSVSYDATYVLFAAIVVILAVTGNTELALLIMAGRYVLRGKQK